MQQKRKLLLPVITAISMRNLKRSKVRTLLSVMGIIIGIFALCTLGMSGAAFTEIVDDMGESNLNLILVTPASENRSIIQTKSFQNAPSISKEDCSRIESAVKKNTTNYELSTVTYVVKPITVNRNSVMTGTYLFGDKKHLEVIVGGFLKEGHLPRMATDVVLLTSTADKYNLKTGSHLKAETANRETVTLTVTGLIDDTLYSNVLSLIYTTDIILAPHELYSILGGYKVFDPVGSSIMSKGTSGQNTILTPADTEMPYNYVIIRLNDPVIRERVATAIDNEINGKPGKRGDNIVMVQDLSALLGDLEEVFSIAVLFAICMSGVALVVASISISNVMIIAVKERKHEIGIMRSLGTTRKQITLIFLFETAVIGIFGSLIGVVLSCIFVPALLILLVQSAGYFLLPSVLVYIPIGFLVGITVCVISGLYPAVKASQISPIEAMER